MDEHSEHWMQRIVDRLDRLIEIGESLEGQVRLPSELEAQTFADAKDLAKEAEPEHPAGPKPDPGEGYRILSKNPPEELMPGDELQYINGTWIASDNARTHRRQGLSLWYRRKIEVAKEPEHPAGPKPDPGEGYRLLSKDSEEELQLGDEVWNTHGDYWLKPCHWEPFGRQDANLWYRRKIEQPKPAWEPKVGDWVRVTRPENWSEWEHPRWEGSMHKSDGMHKFDGQVGQIEREREGHLQIRGFVASKECSYIFHRDWLSPAEPPKPPQPEYREPVLPADFDRRCDFSSDGIEWRNGYLRGYVYSGWRDTNGVCWPCCRIKKEA